MIKIAVLIFLLSGWVSQLNANMFTYVISGFEETTNAKVGKDRLIRNSRVLALKIVMNKFITIEDSNKIDQLLNINNALLFEKSLKVKNESITNTRYSATVEFEFNKTAIWTFFNDNNIGFLENKLNEVVIIMDTSMLESQNEVAQLVQSFNIPNTYLASSIYYDSALIDSSNEEFIAKIRTKYKVRDIYKIKLIKHNDKYELYVINLTNNREVSITDISNIDLLISKAHMLIEEEEKNDKIQTFNTNFVTPVLSFSNKDFKAWNDVQKQLTSITGLIVTYKELSNNNIYFTISYKGNYDNLVDILNNKCININKKNNSLSTMNKC